LTGNQVETLGVLIQSPRLSYRRAKYLL
jgi:hypothetical protein